jgi:hypothetical protein
MRRPRSAQHETQTLLQAFQGPMTYIFFPTSDMAKSPTRASSGSPDARITTRARACDPFLSRRVQALQSRCNDQASWQRRAQRNKPEGALGRCQRLCIARPCTTLHHTETRQHALQHTQFSTAHTSTHKRSSRRALANHTSQRAHARQRALQHTQRSTAHISMHKRTVARAEELSKKPHEPKSSRFALRGGNAHYSKHLLAALALAVFPAPQVHNSLSTKLLTFILPLITHLKSHAIPHLQSDCLPGPQFHTKLSPTPR